MTIAAPLEKGGQKIDTHLSASSPLRWPIIVQPVVAPPLVMPAIVALAVDRPVLVREAEGRLDIRTHVGQHCLLDRNSLHLAADL